LSKLQSKIEEMEEERKAMTLAHQCQITQLKDSFKEKFKQNSDWPDKLANELNKEREKYNNQMQQLEASLKENFRMVLFVCDGLFRSV
jgi:transcription initiation factor IIF auxiliary subunit